MKRIFSIIMEKGLGLPTGTIAFLGTLVPRILTVDYTFKVLCRGSEKQLQVTENLNLRRAVGVFQLLSYDTSHRKRRVIHL